jgi:hypothetical protein
MSRIARRKVNGRCEDCGRSWLPTRVIRFWSSYMAYRVCRECEQPYRRVICWPVTEDQQP